jgi:hypothetical protein
MIAVAVTNHLDPLNVPGRYIHAILLIAFPDIPEAFDRRRGAVF